MTNNSKLCPTHFSRGKKKFAGGVLPTRATFLRMEMSAALAWLCSEACRVTSCWLHQREGGPEAIQEPGGLTTPPTLLGPVLVWNQHNYLRLVLTHRSSHSAQGPCPSKLLEHPDILFFERR